jgi:uncharacterized protein
VSRAIILAVVAVLITVVVYGVVAADREDGRRRAWRWPSGLAESRSASDGAGAGHAQAARLLSVIGTAAMLWVGGHILLVGADELGWHAPTTWSTTSRRLGRSGSRGGRR